MRKRVGEKEETTKVRGEWGLYWLMAAQTSRMMSEAEICSLGVSRGIGGSFFGRETKGYHASRSASFVSSLIVSDQK